MPGAGQRSVPQAGEVPRPAALPAVPSRLRAEPCPGSSAQPCPVWGEASPTVVFMAGQCLVCAGPGPGPRYPQRPGADVSRRPAETWETRLGSLPRWGQPRGVGRGRRCPRPGAGRSPRATRLLWCSAAVSLARGWQQPPAVGTAAGSGGAPWAGPNATGAGAGGWCLLGALGSESQPGSASAFSCRRCRGCGGETSRGSHYCGLRRRRSAVQRQRDLSGKGEKRCSWYLWYCIQSESSVDFEELSVSVYGAGVVLWQLFLA